MGGKIKDRRRSNQRRIARCNEVIAAEKELRGGGCETCGYNGLALHWHHRDPSEKSFRISGNTAKKSLSLLVLELAKCDLLCANCHYELEYDESED